MKSGKNFKISLEELSSRGSKIIAQRSEISFAEALKQVQLLKENSRGSIHNLLFPNTTYSFLGFMENKGNLCAVLQQPFIKGEQADLKDIGELLAFNGFVNTKRQDYFNKEFGLFLEDMHDEDVIAKEDGLFFIDTVFYIMET